MTHQFQVLQWQTYEELKLGNKGSQKVILIAFKKSNPKVFIKRIVTNKPVPEDMEPFNMPIIKTKPINFIQLTISIFLFIIVKPKFGLVKE